MNKILMPEVIAGIHAGALDAIRKARRFGTNLAVWQNGKAVEITPDQAEAMLKEREAKKDHK